MIQSSQPAGIDVATPVESPTTPPRRMRKRYYVMISLLSVLSIAGISPYAYEQWKGERDSEQGRLSAPIPVQVVIPVRKNLIRKYEQPGSVHPWAQADLYAKTSGYLKGIMRVWTLEDAAGFIGDQASMFSVMPAQPIGALAWTYALREELRQARAPRADLGSIVRAGDALLEIDVPELRRDVNQKKAVLKRKMAELESTRSQLKTHEASSLAAHAHVAQAEAEVRKWESDLIFQTKQLERLRELAKSRTISDELADEKQHHVNAVESSLASARAKVQALQAEMSMVSSRMETLRADIMVKEADVQVASEDLERSEEIAEFARLRAPFDGVITQRSVDEGDFIQNSSSGRSRPLMTVTSLDTVRIVLDVPEKEAAWVVLGGLAEVRFDSSQQIVRIGRVNRTSRVLDPRSRTLRVEIDLVNFDHRLLPGMYGIVTLNLSQSSNAHSVPATVVSSRGSKNYVLIIEDGCARKQQVRILSDDGRELAVVKVVQGQDVPFDGSEQLIVSNKGELSDGQRVQATQLP